MITRVRDVSLRSTSSGSIWYEPGAQSAKRTLAPSPWAIMAGPENV